MRIDSGEWFQKAVANALKYRFSYIVVLVCGTESSDFPADRRVYFAEYE